MATVSTVEAVEGTLNEALVELGCDGSMISRGATLAELDIDSLDLAELSQIVEEAHGVDLRADDLAAITTVGDAIDLVALRAG
jgi:acyl carrier protein